MKKIISIFSIFFISKNVLAIESNHSYFKNSDFTNNYSVEVKGLGDFNLFYNNERVNSKTSEFFDRDVSVVLNTVLSSNYDESFRYGIRFVGAVNSVFGRAVGGEIFLEGFLGKLEVGGLKDVTETMRVGADTLAVGTGGISGNAPKFNTSINLMDFLVAPGTLMNQNFGYYDQDLHDKWGGKFSTKINYTTPEFFGFQFGISLKPNVEIDHGNIDVLRRNDNINVGHFISTGINYVNTFGDFGISAAVVYEENFPSKKSFGGKFKSGEVSLTFSYYGLSLAGSYGINSREIKDARLRRYKYKNKGYYFTYGGSYEMGSFCISATFFDSTNGNNRKLWSDAYGVKYNISKNLSWYGEYIGYKFSGSNEANKKGNAFGVFTGILLKF